MKSKTSIVPRYLTVAIAMLVWVSPGLLHAADTRLPAISGKDAVATVNGEPITLNEYARHFAMLHEGVSEVERIKRKDPTVILERMIGTRLIVQEAENIGLDTLPEIQKAIESFQQNVLRSLLFEDHVRNVKRGEPKEIEKIYKESVKEIKVTSVFLDTREDAESLRSAIKKTGDFKRSIRKMLEAGKAKGSDVGGYVKVAELSPDVARIVAGMKAGEVSPIVSVGDKFTILKIEAVRFPENAAKRTEAGKEALNRKKGSEREKLVRSLQKAYVKQNDTVVTSLDFEAEAPGFEALLADDRPVAWIKGESPVTVGEVAEGLKKIFFHGIEQAINQKRVNSKKDQVLKQILAKRVVLKEARRRKLDQSPAYKERVAEYRKELLFGVFVQRVIDPEARADEEELKAFLKEHAADYMVAERVRLELLAFNDKASAEQAIKKLRDGSDLRWVRANAEGQADPSTAGAILNLGGKSLPKSELPEEIREAIAGAQAGDLRLHDSPSGLFCVISVQDVVPTRPEEFENVRDRIAQRVFHEKRMKSLETWVENLKKASKVDIYVEGNQLRRLLETRAW